MHQVPSRHNYTRFVLVKIEKKDLLSGLKLLFPSIISDSSDCNNKDIVRNC